MAGVSQSLSQDSRAGPRSQSRIPHVIPPLGRESVWITENLLALCKGYICLQRLRNYSSFLLVTFSSPLILLKTPLQLTAIAFVSLCAVEIRSSARLTESSGGLGCGCKS